MSSYSKFPSFTMLAAAIIFVMASSIAADVLGVNDGHLLPESTRRGLLSQTSDSLRPSDSLASQVSFGGGTMQYAKDASKFYLTLRAASDHMMVAEDPADPTTARVVDQRIVADTFPRFAVLLTNNSETRTSHPDLTFMSMIIHKQMPDAVDSTKNVDKITYEVELWCHDINNSTGTAGLVLASDLGT